MTISYNWLKQYINFTQTPEEIGAILTSTGLEVESIEPFETIKGGLKGVVIGQVLTCAKHPNADKLSITSVDVGAEKPLSIVCGAPNVAAGQKVAVALVGTTLHTFSGESITLKPTKIRGEVSEGMICAEDEIGLSANHAGIMVLDTNLPNGTPAAIHFKVETDFIYEIGLTPNRADAASHVGVARDLKAALGLPLHMPSVQAFKVTDTSLPIPVTVEDTVGCPRFSGVSIAGVKIQESPEWLKNRLKSIGLSPINNVVDITNFICHELGQPLHAYDADEIPGKKIVVQCLPAGTKFTTLDGKERALAATDLMVCDADSKGMCIAGVFGGLKSGVTHKTVHVFLEGAYWNPNYIRKTGVHHGLKTDASFRFERGTDPNNTAYAVKRAALLILEMAGGKIASDFIDIYPSPIGNRTISVKLKNVNRLIGKEIPQQRIFSILESLDIACTNITADGFDASVPPYRVDVLQEADVVEEILRIYGFNNIELSNTVGADYLAEFPAKDPGKFKRLVGEMLAGSGFQEILTNSLTNVAYQTKAGLSFQSKPVEMLNKLSEEQGILRQSMLFTGLEVCAHNINRKQKELRLVEFGKVYGGNASAEAQAPSFSEQEILALYLTGPFETENWMNAPRAVQYHDMAQAVSHVLNRCNLRKVKTTPSQNPMFDYGMDIMRGNQRIGALGKVKGSICRDMGVKQEVFYAELEVAPLFQSAFPEVKMKETSKFPEVRRDLSLVLDGGIKYEEIQALIAATEKNLISDVVVFDVYQGDKIPEGKKAYALGFTLLDAQKTLTDEEIDRTMARLMTAFEQKLGAIIRK